MTKLVLGSLEGTVLGAALQRAQGYVEDQQYAQDVIDGKLEGYPDVESFERGARLLEIAERLRDGAQPSVGQEPAIPENSVLGRVFRSLSE